MLDRATAVKFGVVEAFSAELPSDQWGDLLESDPGDPGAARNATIRRTERFHVAVYDAVDLWRRGCVVAGATLLGVATVCAAVVVNFHVVFDEHRTIEILRNLDCAKPDGSEMNAAVRFPTSRIMAPRGLVERIPFPARSDD